MPQYQDQVKKFREVRKFINFRSERDIKSIIINLKRKIMNFKRKSMIFGRES